MVELVDTLVLGTSALGRGGSTPSRGTKNMNLNFGENIKFMNKIKLILLSSVLISLIVSQTNQEIIYLKNGSIIKGEIIEKKIDDTITVKSGTNIFNFNYSDVLKIEKNSEDTKLISQNNNKLKAARAYLENSRAQIEINNKKQKKFYYMITGGFARWEDLNRTDYALSFLGFYGNLNSKMLLGFNQTVKANNIEGDLWQYDRLYGLSYIYFMDNIGKDFFTRIDIGYVNNEVIDIDYMERIQDLIEGSGIMLGFGYFMKEDLFIEFDYHRHAYENNDEPLHWYGISIGGLF